MDARWIRKGCGYKDHVKADADSKLIADYTVTPANDHDSHPMPAMIDETDKAVYETVPIGAVLWQKRCRRTISTREEPRSSL